jgi:hypothetical protein
MSTKNKSETSSPREKNTQKRKLAGSPLEQAGGGLSESGFIASGGGINGSGDGLKHIVREHTEVHDEFEKYKNEQKGSVKKEIVEKIGRSLAVHSSIEERYLYPLFRDRLDQGNDVYYKVRFEHQHIKETLELLLKWHPDQQPYLYDELVTYLESLVTNHVRGEERVMALLRSKMSATELAQLDSDMIEGEKNAPTQPHPEGPSSATAAKIMHPIVGMMDQAKEKLKGAAQSAKEVAQSAKDTIMSDKN